MKKSEKGQAVVEFLIILPFILFVLLGMVTVGAGFARYEQIENAASEGARAAQVYKAQGTITCYQYAVNAIQAAVTYPVIVTTSENCSDTNPWLRISSNESVTVTVVHDYEPIFFGTALKDQWEPPTTIPLTASVTTKHE